MKRFFLIIFFISVLTQLIAVPAYPKPVVFTQPNGKQVTLIMQGDEFVRFAQTLDGYTLLYDKEGYFCYAQKNIYGDIEPSAFYAEDISNRSTESLTLLSNTPKQLFFSTEQISMYQQIRDMVEKESRNTKGNTTGVRKLLTILMQYPDRPFVKTQEDFHNLFNQIKYTEYNANGSVKDFFLESSYGKLEVETTVVGPFTAKNKHAYYGSFEHARELATEAVYAAHDFGVDFSKFAYNGEVPSFYMIFAGNGQEAGAGVNSIWSHAWSIDPTYFDGVKISSYACSPEHSGAGGSMITRIGVICHEFGHSLGAPDYYDTDYGTGGQYDGTGTWELQASGSWNDSGRTPAPPNPRSKVYTYGWATVIELNAAQTVTIPSARIYDNAYFRINTQTPGEYFILENKIRGGYDDYIPGTNMLIYHCAANTSGMNTTSPQKFYPVAANAPVDLPDAGTNCKSQYGSINSGSCPWPGYLGKTEFTDTTIPAMISWNRLPTEKPITNITTHGNFITFDIMGGGTKDNYLVFLPNSHGCKFTPEPDFNSPVGAGENFEFRIEIDSLYNESIITIKSNGQIITPTDDIFTLSNIQSDQIVTIEGLKINTVDIIASVGTNGTIFPNDTLQIPIGQNQRYSISPNLGFSIEDVFVDGVSVGPVYDYVFKNVTEPHTITARFKYGDKYSINLSDNILQFATNPGVHSEYQIVTISSQDIKGNITIKAPEKFQISSNGKRWYKAFLITKKQLPHQLYIRYIPAEDDRENALGKITLCANEAYSEIILIGNIVLDVPESKIPEITVFPNPTTGELRITNCSYVSGKFSEANYESRIENVEIFDIFGAKLISHQQINLSSDYFMNISHFKSGIYLMAIQTPSGKFYKKIIKY